MKGLATRTANIAVGRFEESVLDSAELVFGTEICFGEGPARLALVTTQLVRVDIVGQHLESQNWRFCAREDCPNCWLLPGYVESRDRICQAKCSSINACPTIVVAGPYPVVIRIMVEKLGSIVYLAIRRSCCSQAPFMIASVSCASQLLWLGNWTCNGVVF